MSETPKVGDTVRVSRNVVIGVVQSVVDGTLELDGYQDFDLDRYEVEILDRADDPSKDPVGTVRRNFYRVLIVKQAPDLWVVLSTQEHQFQGSMGDDTARRNGYESIGVVPDSPADKLKAEFYNGQNLRYRVQGDKAEYWDTSSLIWRSSIIEASAVRRFPRLDSDPTDGR